MKSNNNQHGLPDKAWCALLLFSFFLSIYQSRASIESRGFNFVNDKTETIIPFKLVNNLIVVPAKINTNLEVNLVFDTGVRSLVLFGSHFKNQLAMTDREVQLMGYGKNKTRKAALSLENSVSISDIEGNGISILVSPSKHLFSSKWDVKIHGLIGYQIFSRFVVQIDYPNRVIVLREPDQFVASSSLVQKPLLVKDTKPYVPMSFALGEDHNNQAYFHVDTGSGRELILFMKDGRYEKLKKKRSLIGRGLNGKLNGFKSSNASLGLLGDKSIVAGVHLFEKDISENELNEVYGTIGSALLKDYIIIFDYVHQRFYIKKPQIIKKTTLAVNRIEYPSQAYACLQ